MSWYKYAVKAKRNKGMKNASHGLNPGRRYWCHASDSLTEPSGPAASSGSRWHDTNSGRPGFKSWLAFFIPLFLFAFTAYFVPGHIASHLNVLGQYLLQSRTKDSCKAAICLTLLWPLPVRVEMRAVRVERYSLVAVL